MSIRFRSPFSRLYSEAGLQWLIRRSITMMIFGNIFGNLFGTITTGSALTGYAQALGSNDFMYGVLTGIPLAASLMQIPASLMVCRTQNRKKYMLTFGIFGRAVWIVIGLVPYFLPMQPLWLRLWCVFF